MRNTEVQVTTAKEASVQRSTELVRALAGFFDSEMEYGERIRMTRLAKSIAAAGKHPHVQTVRHKCTELALMKEVLERLRFCFDGDGKLVEIVKIRSDSTEGMRKIRQDLSQIRGILNELRGARPQ